MPDIQSGLTEGDVDVNTPEGFVAALAGKVGADVPEEYAQELRDTDTSVASALERSNDQGRQEPEAQEEEPEVPADAGQTEEETPALDEAVQTYIEQHGGSPEQAIAALYDEFQNAQQLIGRQSAEVGDVRTRLEQMESFLAQQGQQGETFDAPLPTSEEREPLESFFEERGAQQAMNWIVENRPDMIEDAVTVWQEIDPVAATRFATRYDRYLEAEQSAPQAAAPQEDPFLAQMKQQAQFTASVEQARVESGLSDEEWTSVKEHVIPALNDPSTSVLIKNAVAQPQNAQQQVEGMKALYQIAQARAALDANAKATEAARTQAQETAATKKQAARVATGSLTPPKTEGQSGNEEQERADAIKAFKQNLLNAETTDVASGLTHGKPNTSLA